MPAAAVEAAVLAVEVAAVAAVQAAVAVEEAAPAGCDEACARLPNLVRAGAQRR